MFSQVPPQLSAVGEQFGLASQVCDCLKIKMSGRLVSGMKAMLATWGTLKWALSRPTLDTQGKIMALVYGGVSIYLKHGIIFESKFL